jgi:glycosyltransferase involved in cell wall biosynthesis
MRKICVYTICKNEEKNVQRWYNSVKDADAIVVIDTGSTDNTWNELLSCGDNMYIEQFIQTNGFDFSVARNFSLDQARSVCTSPDEWIYVTLDLDEFIDEGGITAIKDNWLSEYDTMLLRGIVDSEGNEMFLKHKIHSSNPAWIWKRAVHEILELPEKKQKDWVTSPNAYTSYTHEQDKTKQRDYYELLKKDYEQDPTNIKTLMYLAWEAYEHGDLDEFFLRSEDAIQQITSNESDELYLDYENLIQAYINCYTYMKHKNDKENMLQALNAAISVVENGDFPAIRRVYILRGDYYNEFKMFSEAIADYERALSIKEHPFCWIETPHNDAELYSSISNAYYYSGDYLSSLAYAECAVSMDPDNDRYVNNRDICLKKAQEDSIEMDSIEVVETPDVTPVKNKICVYAMCKNERQFVSKWLDSMSEADYIVVLDTGSTDGTYEMLKADPRVTRCEQKVITPWRFDVARNESMKLIPEDANILISTDLDELLDKGWATPLRERWIDGFHKRGYYTYAWSHNESGEPARVFTYDKIHSREWHWEFPVHEMLVLPDMTQDFPREQSIYFGDEIYLHHWPDQTKSRSSYLGLLELRKEEYPDDYYGRIYLAHEYYYRGFYEESIAELKDILQKHAGEYDSIEQASCYLFMGDSYRALGKNSEAIGSYYQALFIDDTYREPYYALADLFNSLEQYEYTIPLLNLCLKKTYRHFVWIERDDAWAGGIHDLLSVAYYWTGRYEEGFVSAQKALQYNPKDERLIKNLEYCKEMMNYN